MAAPLPRLGPRLRRSSGTASSPRLSVPVAVAPAPSGNQEAPQRPGEPPGPASPEPGGGGPGGEQEAAGGRGACPRQGRLRPLPATAGALGPGSPAAPGSARPGPARGGCSPFSGPGRRPLVGGVGQRTGTAASTALTFCLTDTLHPLQKKLLGCVRRAC